MAQLLHDSILILILNTTSHYSAIAIRVANKDVKYMKLLKCLCSSATCAQTAQLTSQHVRQARTTREMRATALASAGGSAAVALPFGCCGRATNGGAG